MFRLLFVFCLFAAAFSDELFDTMGKNITQISYDELVIRPGEKKYQFENALKVKIPGTEMYCGVRLNIDKFCHIMADKAEDVVIDKELLKKFDKVTFVRLAPFRNTTVKIDENVYTGAPDLTNLLLRDIYVKKTFFDTLENLKFLRFEMCDYEEDINILLEKVKKLEHLAIDNDGGPKLPAVITRDFFRPFFFHIQTLTIFDRNVEQVQFTDLPKLEELNICHCKLADISTFKDYLPSLSKLRVYDNKLTKINWADFQSYPNMTHLEIDHNDIVNLDAAEIAANIKSLKYFSYSSTRMSLEDVQKFKADLQEKLPGIDVKYV